MDNLVLSQSAFNASTQEAEVGDLFEFKASLVYLVSSKMAKAT